MKSTHKSMRQPAKLLMRGEKKMAPANQEGLHRQMPLGLWWLGVYKHLKEEVHMVA